MRPIILMIVIVIGGTITFIQERKPKKYKAVHHGLRTQDDEPYVNPDEVYSCQKFVIWEKDSLNRNLK